MLAKHLLVLVISAIVISASMGIFYVVSPNNPFFCAFQPPKAHASTEYEYQADTTNPCYVTPTAWMYDGIQQLYRHNPYGAIYNLETGAKTGNLPFNSGSVCVAHIDPATQRPCGWFVNEGPQNNIRNEVPSDPSTYHRGYLRVGGYGPYNQDQWRSVGYMDTPKDWKNLEVSALFYLPPGSGKGPGIYGPEGVDYVIKGGTNENGPQSKCQAQNYHVGFMPSGMDQYAKLERDIEHTAGYCAPCLFGKDLNPNIKGVPNGKVFGFKVVLYNNQANTATRIDAYVDYTGSGSKWTPIYSYIDNGKDPRIDSVRGQTTCAGLRPDLPVTFGGPLTGLRLNWNGAYYRQLTIDEIQPPRW